MYSLQLPFLLIVLGISAIQVMGGGEDWYDVWFSGEHYGWTTDFQEFFRCLGFVVVIGIGLSFLWSINPSTYHGSYPSYEESTPIKVPSSTSASKQKKTAHKNRVATKRHSARHRRVSQLPGSTGYHQALSN